MLNNIGRCYLDINNIVGNKCDIIHNRSIPMTCHLFFTILRVNLIFFELHANALYTTRLLLKIFPTDKLSNLSLICKMICVISILL